MFLLQGVINKALAIVLWILALGLTGYGGHRLGRPGTDRRILIVGLAVVVTLLLQLIPLATVSQVGVGAMVEFGVLGAVMLAAILGLPASCFIMSVVITLQWLLFNKGGISLLGINIFNIGVITAGSGYYLLLGFKAILPEGRKSYIVALAMATWLATIIGGLTTTLEIVFSAHLSPGAIFSMIRPTLITGIIEALITLVVVLAVINKRPDLVKTYCCSYDKEKCMVAHMDQKNSH